MKFETEEFSFSSAQLEGVRGYADQLERLVKTYRISSESVDRDEASEVASSDPNRVFSLYPDWDYPVGEEVTKVGYGLTPGFDEDCDEFYISELAFDEPPSPYPYTEIHVPCVECDTNRVDEDGNECGNCGEGEFTFDLVWDEDGNVTAEASDA